MDIHSLEVYLTLCRHLHFGRTSDACHMSPSTLSRLIRKLEIEVGHELLLRDNRTASLTEQGELFREFATETLASWDKLKNEMGEADAVLSGKLTIFASVTASQTILPTVLTRFRDQYPGIHIQLDTGYAVNALQSLRDGCDVAVAALNLNEDVQFTQKIITSTPIVPVASEHLLNQLQSDGGDSAEIIWQDVPLILPSHGQVRSNIDRWYQLKNLRKNIYSEVEGNEATLSLVALGCGIGFVPELVLNSSPLKTQLRRLDNGPKLDAFHVGFCVRSKTLQTSKLIQAFWDSI